MIEILLHIPKKVANLLTKLICIYDKFSKPVLLYGGKNTANKLIEPILKKYDYYKNGIKNIVNKNLVMSAKDEEEFQSSNNCWICNKLLDVGANKMRDHCHIAGKYRGSAHRSCNINFKLIKKVPVL